MSMYQIYRKMQVVPFPHYTTLTAGVFCVVLMLAVFLTPLSTFAAPTTTKKPQTKSTVQTPKKAQPKKKPAQPKIIPVRQAFFPTIPTGGSALTQGSSTPNSAPQISPKPTAGDTNNPVPPHSTMPEPKIRVVPGPYIRYTPELSKIELASRVEAATVNIICSVRIGNETRSSVGSGVVVSSDGLVLTNAHVGAFSLFPEQILSQQPTDPFAKKTQSNCIARGGSPAVYLYDLQPIYIPKEWVTLYAARLFENALSGTGAGDYMLLKRKVYTDPSVIRPTPLAFLPPDTNRGSLESGDSVLGSGYPAEFLGTESIAASLYYAASFITVGEGFTFVANTPDTFSLGGSILARAGISGGPAVDSWGKLVGIMSTSTREGTTAERTLRAISVDYINRDIQEKLGLHFEDLLTQTDNAQTKSKESVTSAQTLFRELYVHTNN